MRLLRTSCLLATALSAACATSMQSQDAAAVKQCTKTIPLHETPEADRYAAITEVSGWTVDALLRQACELGADAVVGLHSETFRTTAGDGEVLWVGHAATLVPPSQRREEAARAPRRRSGPGRERGSCAATLPLYPEEELEGHELIEPIVAGTREELAVEACELGADAVVAVRTGQLGITGLAVARRTPAPEPASAAAPQESPTAPPSEPGVAQPAPPSLPPESAAGAALPDAAAVAQTPGPRAEAGRRPLLPEPEPAAPAHDPAFRHDIERSVARRQEESTAVPEAVVPRVSRAKRLEKPVSPGAALGMSILVTALGVGGGIFLVASGAELGLVLIPVGALVGPSTGLMLARRHGRAWVQVGLRAAIYGVFVVAAVKAAFNDGPGWGALAVVSLLGGAGTTLYSFWDAYDKASELNAQWKAQHASAALGDDPVQIHPFVLRDGGGGLVLKHSF